MRNCPFCNSENIGVIDVYLPHIKKVCYFQIICHNCEARSPIGTSIYEVVKQWDEVKENDNCGKI